MTKHNIQKRYYIGISKYIDLQIKREKKVDCIPEQYHDKENFITKFINLFKNILQNIKYKKQNIDKLDNFYYQKMHNPDTSLSKKTIIQPKIRYSKNFKKQIQELHLSKQLNNKNSLEL